MGDELRARADGGDETVQAGSAGAADSTGADAGEQWRRGFLDPENWHDLAERGTPRNG